MTNWTFTSSGTDTGTSPRILLCHSGFKGLAVSSVWGIVTFNNCQSLLFGFFMNTSISHQFFPHQGGKYEYTAIHEIAVNLGQFIEFFMSNTCSRYPSYPSQGYPSDANSHKERTKEVWTLQPKPSQLEEQHRLGATVQPYPAIT